MKLLIVLQVIAAGVASLLAYYSVETIIGSCPIVAIFGLLVAAACLNRPDPLIFVFGLSAPLLTVVVAELIAILRWGPREASRPIGILLACYFAATLVCLPLTLSRKGRRNGSGSRSTPSLQFSLRSLLGLMTVACVLFAALRPLAELRSDRVVFGCYAGVMLVAVVALTAMYVRRAARRAAQDMACVAGVRAAETTREGISPTCDAPTNPPVDDGAIITTAREGS